MVERALLSGGLRGPYRQRIRQLPRVHRSQVALRATPATTSEFSERRTAQAARTAEAAARISRAASAVAKLARPHRLLGDRGRPTAAANPAKHSLAGSRPIRRCRNHGSRKTKQSTVRFRFDSGSCVRLRRLPQLCAIATPTQRLSEELRAQMPKHGVARRSADEPQKPKELTLCDSFTNCASHPRCAFRLAPVCRLRGRAEFQSPCSSECPRLYARSAFFHQRHSRSLRRRSTAICSGPGHPRRLVDALSFSPAEQFDRALAQGQSGHQGGASGLGGRKRERAGSTWRLLSERFRRFHGKQAADIHPALSSAEREHIQLQPVHAGGGCFVCAGCVWTQPAHRRVAEGAGAASALRAGRNAHHAQLQRGGSGHSGSVLARANHRHEAADRYQHRHAADLAPAVRAGLCGSPGRRGAGIAARASRVHVTAAGEAIGATTRPAGGTLRRIPEPGTC